MEKRRFRTIILFLLVFAASLFALAAVGCTSEKEEGCSHENRVLFEERAATCTEAGAEVYHCADCGEYLETVILPAKGHTQVSLTAVAPTCTQSGLTEGAVCSVCQTVLVEQKTIAPLPHEEEIIEQRASSCVQAGFIRYACKTCHAERVVELSLAEHSYDEGVVTKAATCTESGIKTLTCYECGATKTNVVPATGHTENPEGTVTLAATCTENGTMTYYCQTCGEALRTAAIPATGHHYDDGVITKAATCTESGIKTLTCYECGATKTNVVPATGHTENPEGTVTLAATCTVNGTMTYYCQTCGEALRTAAIPATGHHYDDGVITKAATCTESGIKTYTCGDCLDTKTEIIPATGHTENPEGTVTLAATCTENGTMTYYCQTCGEALRTAAIPATGHHYDDGVITKAATCTESGIKTYTCGDCLDIKTEAIPATGHTENPEGTVTLAATCTENGTMTYYCQTCGEALRTAAIPATGHHYDDGVITKAATCTEGGIKTYTCGDCLDTKTEIIPATGHTEIPIGEAKAPTCLETGFTAGVKCSVCGAVIEEQQVLPLSDHCYVNGVCSVCGEEKVYKVTFLSNGQVVDVQTYTVSDKNILEPEVPELEGYISEGWEYYTLTGDVTVNAVYSPIQYRITLYAGSGTCSAKTYDVAYGAAYTLPVATYEGYVFVGWFSSASSNAIQYTDESGLCLAPYAYAGNKNFYAHWSAPEVAVTLDRNNGQPLKNITITYGTAFSVEEAPVKEGAIFDGWFTENGTEYTATTIVRESVTLIAKWTVSKPVSTAEELFAIAEDPTANYHLTNNITLPNSNKIWTAIASFSGILNGNGYTITNISFTTGNNAASYGFVAVNEGIIENLNFERVTFTQTFTGAKNCVSGIVAGQNNGTVKNCHLLSGTLNYTISFSDSGGDWTCNDVVGTVVGSNNGTVADCSSKISVSATLDLTNNHSAYAYSFNHEVYLYLGGLVGINSGTIKNSYYNGTVITSSSAKGQKATSSHWQTNIHRVGGLVGENKGTVNECYAVAEISWTASNNNYGYNYMRLGGMIGSNVGGIVANSFSNGSIVSGWASSIGGFVGGNYTSSSIYNSYSTVDLTINASAGEYGGFVGQTDGSNIAGCYASGNINSTAGGTMGGFVGVCGSSGSISNSYSCGSVTASKGTAGLFVGSSSTAISDCYFRSDAYLSIGGVFYDVSSELNGTIGGKECYEVWSEAFLTEELFWTSQDGWIILTDEDPILDWEVAVFHHYETYVFEPTCDYSGYTLYMCTDCTRFFVRDIVAPLGHDYDYDHPVVKEATCTESGYKYYVCLREDCTEEDGRIFVAETYQPLGHAAGEIVYGTDSEGKEKTYAATCTEKGKTTYLCTVCGKEFSVEEQALGHDEYTTVAELSVSCYYDAEKDEYITVSGHTAEISCKRCGIVIQQSVEVEGHHQFEYRYTVEPTCTEVGYGSMECTMCHAVWNNAEIPALGHVDVNGDHRCDRCHALLLTDTEELKEGEYTEIKDEQGLRAIANDLNGIYVLTADISITGEWIPLGTKDIPFTGRLFGEGHAITGLTIENSEAGGLFAYNNGFISGITINGFSLSVSNADCVFGGIAAYNWGTIFACEVSGQAVIKVETIISTAEISNNLNEFTDTIGGIVGINQRLGLVSSCISSAKYTNTFVNKAITTFATDYNLFQFVIDKVLPFGKVQFKKYVTQSINVIYFGQICGINSATIEGCVVSGTSSSDITLNAAAEKFAGTAYAATYLYQKSAACGYNSGSLDNGNGSSFSYTLHRNGVKPKEGFYYKIYTDFMFYND